MTEDEWREHYHRRCNSDVPHTELLLPGDGMHDPPSSGDLIADVIDKITRQLSDPYYNWFDPIDTVSLYRAEAEAVREVLINSRRTT
jgi:hypothetical protein